MNNARRKRIEAIREALSPLVGQLEEIAVKLADLKDDVEGIKNDEEEAKENLPESLQYGDMGQMMVEAMSELDSAADALSELSDAMGGKIEEIDAHLESALQQ